MCKMCTKLHSTEPLSRGSHQLSISHELIESGLSTIYILDLLGSDLKQNPVNAILDTCNTTARNVLLEQ